MKVILLVLITILFSVNQVYAQYEDDTKSIQSTIDALYEVISGDAGVERDWERFENLFVPEAKLMPTGKNQEGKVVYRVWSPQEYIDVAGPSLKKDGFFESELSHEIEQFGNIAHVFSTYDSRRTKDGEVFARGINSIQLLNDGNRWWVVSIFWSSENEEYPIPEKYLKMN